MQPMGCCTRPRDQAAVDEQASEGVGCGSRSSIGNWCFSGAAWSSMETASLGYRSCGGRFEGVRMSIANGGPASQAEFNAFAQEVFQLARSGDAPTLIRLLEKGLPPNMSNHKGDTLLMLAAYHGHVEATKTLLEAGADPDKYNDMAQTPLGWVHLQGPSSGRASFASSWSQAGLRPAGRQDSVDVCGHVQQAGCSEAPAVARRGSAHEELRGVVRRGAGKEHGRGRCRRLPGHANQDAGMKLGMGSCESLPLKAPRSCFALLRLTVPDTPART